MKILVLKDNEVKFMRRMVTQGFWSCKQNGTDKLGDYKMVRLLLSKTKCVDKNSR